MEQVDRAPVTNREIGLKIGVSHAQVSRLRNGGRKPSITTMANINIFLGWDIRRQIRAMRNRTYGPEFEQFLRERYPEGMD